MPEDGERIARLEQQIVGLHDELNDRKHEEERTRDRLHKIEGVLGLLVDQAKQNRRQEAEQYRRVELRLQLLAVIVALAAVVVPLTITLAHLGR